MYAYNSSCYEAQLGRIAEAKAYLQQGFAIKPRFREDALDYPDLEPVWQAVERL